MDSQIDNEIRPEWAEGMTKEEIQTLRREAVRQGKLPSELVREWILDFSDQLTLKPSSAA